MRRPQPAPGHGYDRPNAVPGQKIDLDSSKRSTDQWFNIQALAIQPLGTYGNLGRTVGHGPEIFGMDFSTLKNFNFAEKRYLQFRFEAFNFLNHPNFGDPGTSLSSNTLNSAGVPIVGTGSLGVIKSTRGSIDMRELQFSLKLVF